MHCSLLGHPSRASKCGQRLKCAAADHQGAQAVLGVSAQMELTWTRCRPPAVLPWMSMALAQVLSHPHHFSPCPCPRMLVRSRHRRHRRHRHRCNRLHRSLHRSGHPGEHPGEYRRHCRTRLRAPSFLFASQLQGSSTSQATCRQMSMAICPIGNSSKNKSRTWRRSCLCVRGAYVS